MIHDFLTIFCLFLKRRKVWKFAKIRSANFIIIVNSCAV